MFFEKPRQFSHARCGLCSSIVPKRGYPRKLQAELVAAEGEPDKRHTLGEDCFGVGFVTKQCCTVQRCSFSSAGGITCSSLRNVSEVRHKVHRCNDSVSSTAITRLSLGFGQASSTVV